MKKYNHNYQYTQKNYNELTNTIQNYPQNFNNDFSDSFHLYGVKTYQSKNINQYNNVNKNCPIIYTKNVNTLNLDLNQEIGIIYSKDKFLKQKAPKDSNKIPKDNYKNKQNINNITTINNNSYNKINSINIILDTNNFYNDDIIKYKNYNNSNYIRKSKSKKNERVISKNHSRKVNKSKSAQRIERQPKDNYKNYPNIMNKEKENFTLTKSNNIIKLNKNGKKQQKDKILFISKINDGKNTINNNSRINKNIKTLPNDSIVNVNNNNRSFRQKIINSKNKLEKAINDNIQLGNINAPKVNKYNAKTENQTNDNNKFNSTINIKLDLKDKIDEIKMKDNINSPKNIKANDNTFNDNNNNHNNIINSKIVIKISENKKAQKDNKKLEENKNKKNGNSKIKKMKKPFKVSKKTNKKKDDIKEKIDGKSKK